MRVKDTISVVPYNLIGATSMKQKETMKAITKQMTINNSVEPTTWRLNHTDVGAAYQIL